MRRSVGRLGLRAPVLLALLPLFGLHWTRPLAAQQGGLEDVDGLVRAGRTEEARTVLLAWWEASWSGATRDDAQRALWVRARLTVDPLQAELDYRRLVIEYPGGPFSDDALLRLAQSAHALGNVDAARQSVELLERDYPESAATREARRWLDGAGSPLARVAGSQLTPRPPGSGGREIVAAERPRPPAQVGPPPTPRGRYAVQLGAFESSARATTLRDRASELGVADARLVTVPGSRLIRVRAGRFDSEAAARDLLAAVRRLGLPATLVMDADREESVGA